MVAPRLIAAELLKRRKEDQSRSKKTNLNRADLRVIGSSCQGYSPSLLVNSEGNTYLFNCGEGTQRNCYANRIKITSLENLFITRLHWPAVSGTYGLSLTLQDVGLPKFVVHSSDRLSDFFKSVEYFMTFTTGIDCKTNDCTLSEFDDEKLRVRCIPIDSHEINYDEQSTKKKRCSPTLLAYHCSLPDLPGPLNPTRCRELRVPVGPMLAQLKSGKDVKLSDGTTVKSVDVCGPKSIGSNFIIVDCPKTTDIRLVVENPDLKRLQWSRQQDGQTQVDLVVHFSPEEVTTNVRYKQWMDEFHDSCKHILLNNSAFRRANFIDSYRLQYLLHKIEPELFPTLYMPAELAGAIENEIQNTSTLVELPENDDGAIETISRGPLDDQDRIINASTFDCFNLRPFRACESASDKMCIDSVYRAAKFDPDYDTALSRYREVTKGIPSSKSHEPEVVFLGTGSALPSKLRNTSCILVNFYVPQRASIILDCGEDSYGQIVRHYGPENANEILKNLKMIYVSHHHADHHIGLIELLRRKKQVNPELLQLLLPPGIDTHLNFYNDTFENLRDTYDVVNTKDLRSRYLNGHPNPIARSLCDSLNGLLKNISLVNVEHCSNACAVVMDFNINRPGMDRFRLAYSGDARPSLEFAKIGECCDLLIHEATFDHREPDAALEKKHSTTSEAINLAKKMGAKFTILTHFSQRYPKIPYFTEQFDDTIGFAFDHMAVRCPSQLVRLPKMKDILRVVFSKSLNEIDSKHSKTEMKQMRLKTQ